MRVHKCVCVCVFTFCMFVLIKGCPFLCEYFKHSWMKASNLESDCAQASPEISAHDLCIIALVV